MNVNVFIDQVVVQSGRQLPAEANQDASADAAATAAPRTSPPVDQQGQSSPSEEAHAQPQGKPPYWDSTGPKEPPLVESSAEWRLARRPDQVRSPTAWHMDARAPAAATCISLFGSAVGAPVMLLQVHTWAWVPTFEGHLGGQLGAPPELCASWHRSAGLRQAGNQSSVPAGTRGGQGDPR